MKSKEEFKIAVSKHLRRYYKKKQDEKNNH